MCECECVCVCYRLEVVAGVGDGAAEEGADIAGGLRWGGERKYGGI